MGVRAGQGYGVGKPKRLTCQRAARPCEGLVRQCDAAAWRQIAELRWQMIVDLTRERDELHEKLRQKETP